MIFELKKLFLNKLLPRKKFDSKISVSGEKGFLQEFRRSNYVSTQRVTLQRGVWLRWPTELLKSNRFQGTRLGIGTGFKCSNSEILSCAELHKENCEQSK